MDPHRYLSETKAKIVASLAVSSITIAQEHLLPDRGYFRARLTLSNTSMDKRYSEMKLDRITIDPARMNGQPCIRSMRLTVRRVVELAAVYPNREELRQEYPELEDEDIRQALLYAATCLDDRSVELPLSHETAA